MKLYGEKKMNINYIKYLAEKLSFPIEGVDSLLADAKRITENDKADILFTDAVESFARTDYSFDGMEARFESIAEHSGVHRYAVAMLVLMQSCETLEKKYDENGYSDQLFVDTMSDLKFKLIECKDTKGVWGNFVSFWYPGFFRMTRFALGRFQYEKIKYTKKTAGIAGNFVKEGDTVLNFHIPSSGVSLTEQVRYDSYRRAKEFFFPDSDKPIPFVCSSWLLWPDYESALPEKSNLMAFRHDFTLVDANAYDSFTNAWRVYGAYAECDVSQWPRDTSQRRAFAEHTEKGGTHGSGYGVFFFDGEKIVK